MSKSYAPVFRSLAAMHRAGIAWPRALESAAGGDPHYASAQSALERGEPLGQALSSVVDALDAALLEAGEKDGSLERVLTEIADAHDASRRDRREELTGLFYPLILAHIAGVLMALPDLIQGHPGGAFLWAAAILAPTWGFLLWRRRQARASRVAPGTGDPPAPPPAVGPWRNRVEEADARALDAMGRLYEAGVPVAESLDLSIAAGWGGRAAADLAEARRRVARGRDLAGAWHLLPDELAGRLRAAEESGSLGEAFSRVAQELRFDVRTRRQRVAAVLPVLAMLCVGALVALRLFSFYSGLYGRIGR